jgi:hypothetical protein
MQANGRGARKRPPLEQLPERIQSIGVGGRSQAPHRGPFVWSEERTIKSLPVKLQIALNPSSNPNKLPLSPPIEFR